MEVFIFCVVNREVTHTSKPAPPHQNLLNVYLSILYPHPILQTTTSRSPPQKQYYLTHSSKQLPLGPVLQILTSKRISPNCYPLLQIHNVVTAIQNPYLLNTTLRMRTPSLAHPNHTSKIASPNSYLKTRSSKIVLRNPLP